MLSEKSSQDIQTLIILIWWGLMITAYGFIEYGLFSNPHNKNIYQLIFISLPLGVMFVGLPLLVLAKDDEGLFWIIFIIGLIIFIVGLALASMVGAG